jgi:hypothetical protein
MNETLLSSIQLIKKIELRSSKRKRWHASGSHLFFHYNIAFVIELPFMPESTVGTMKFTGCGANGEILSKSLIVCSSFVSSGFRGFPFRIWHNS